MRKAIRRLRHWKQRFNKNADFIWRRTTLYAGETYRPGDPIPEQLVRQPTKLRRFWESSRIELAEFEAPDVATGQVESAPVILMGSNVLDSTYEIGGETVALGVVVSVAFEHSGLSVEEWNALDPDAREEMLARSLECIQYQGEDEDPLLSVIDGAETSGQPVPDKTEAPETEVQVDEVSVVEDTESSQGDTWLEGEGDSR